MQYWQNPVGVHIHRSWLFFSGIWLRTFAAHAVRALLTSVWFVALGCLLFFSQPSAAQADINLTDQLDSVTIGTTPEQLSAQAAFSISERWSWRQPPEITGLLPVGQERWYRLRLNQTADHDRILEIPHPTLGVVDVWMRDGQGRFAHDRAGLRVPYQARKQPGHGLAFSLPTDLQPPVDVLIRVNNQGPLEFSLFVKSIGQWLRSEHLMGLLYGGLFGAILVLLLYNLFIAWGLKDPSYALYVLFLLSLLLTLFFQSGIGKQFLWPARTDIESRFMIPVAAMNTTAGLTFLVVFFNLRQLSRPLWLAAGIIIGISLPLALLNLLGYHNPGLLVLIYLNILASLVYYMLVPIVAYHRGLRFARFAIPALWVYPVSVFSYFWQLVTGNYWLYPPYLVMAFGILAEGILLSLALTDKINLLRQAKKNAERQADAARQDIARRLIQTQERERENFASILHDAIGHDLLLLKHGLEQLDADANCSSSKDNQRILRRLRKQCEGALVNVRELSHQMHPHVLARLGLNAAIETMLENVAKATNLEWAADLDNIDGLLDEEKSSTIYRVIQEALNNVLKHAQAYEVLVSLRVRGGQVVVSVKDDGSGWEESVDASAGKGLGLDNMAGRVELLSGWFRLLRQPGCGTEVRFGIPIVS